MAAVKKDTATNKSSKKAMSKKEKLFLTVLSFILVTAIICVCVFLLYPKLAGRPDWHVLMFLDFDDSEWIEEMVDNRIEPIGKQIEIRSSFVYSADTAFINTTYGSTASIEEARKHYLGQIPESIDVYADAASQMKVMGTLNEEDVDIINYEAEMLNALDTKVTIDKDVAEKIKGKLLAEYPSDVVKKYPELAAIMRSEKLGGRITYDDDELSSKSYPGVPIFSEAYRYPGYLADLVLVQKSLDEKYSHSVYLEDIGALYFWDEGYIISLSITESDLNLLAVITVQKSPEGAVIDE